MSLFAELKRRNVIKVTGAYLALGWVVTQVTGEVVPALNLPASLVPIVVWIGLIGFPFVVVFAWVFEVTPEGVKRTAEIAPGQSIAPQTGKRLEYLIIALLVVAIGLFTIDLTRDESSVGAGPARDSVGAGLARDSSVAALPAPDRAQGALLQEKAPDDKSIAVLPFVNMSSDKDRTRSRSISPTASPRNC
jgi:hypothetical protein